MINFIIRLILAICKTYIGIYKTKIVIYVNFGHCVQIERLIFVHYGNKHFSFERYRFAISIANICSFARASAD